MSLTRKLTRSMLPVQNLRKEYNDAMVDFVDFEVINAALSTIRGFPIGKTKPCSLSRMHDICNRNKPERKGTRWTNFVNKNTKSGTRMKVAFPLVRECADFLAIPAWLMLSPGHNSDLIYLLKTLPAGIPRFVLFSDYEMLHAEKQMREWEHNNGNVTGDKILEEMAKLGLFNSVHNYPWQNKDPYNRVKGPFNKVLELMQLMTTIPHAYAYGGDIILRGMKEIPAVTSTFRMAKGYFPSHRNTKDADHNEEWWQTCWYALRCPVNSYNYCVSYTEYVSQCFSDILDRFPIEIEVHEDGWITRLYSWHSHRIHYGVDRLNKIIIKRILDSHGKLTVLMERIYRGVPSTPTTSNLPLTCPIGFNDQRQFLIWISSDFGFTKHTMRALIRAKPSHDRRPNTISVLLQCSVLQEGTLLLFRSPDCTIKLEKEDRIAEVQIDDNGRPAVKWRRDGKKYSVSALAAKIILLSGGTVPNRVNGNKYFCIDGESETLYDKRVRLETPCKPRRSTKMGLR